MCYYLRSSGCQYNSSKKPCHLQNGAKVRLDKILPNKLIKLINEFGTDWVINLLALRMLLIYLDTQR